MEDYCSKTCGFCEDEEDESDCVDELGSDKCGRIKSNGKCDKQWAQKKCQATCGMCDDEEATEAPATTPEAPETTPGDDGPTEAPPSTSEPVECTTENEGNCECGDTSQGFTTYTFFVGDVQRCFTVFHPVSRVGEKLPVVLSPNCYAKDSLRGISMTSATRGDNAAATKYGYVRIGLSTPDGGWTFGNDNIVNDEKPMPCSEADSKDNTYLKIVFDFIDSNPDKFDADKIYAEGFSQNSMFSAYTAFCFHDKVLGVWQGGSGLTLTGQRPFVPNKGAQCSMSSYEQYGHDCVNSDPCTSCQYWPIYPCYSETRPMIDCVMEYTNDGVSVQHGESSAEHMYEKLVNEGHDGRLLRFSPSEDGTIEGSHKDPKNKAHWYVGCLGITEPCSSECEDSFTSCMSTKDLSTAENKASAFGECIEDSADLAGCTAECAPTYAMLIQSEEPTEVSFSNGVFGPTAEDHIEQPETSLCKAEDQV